MLIQVKLKMSGMVFWDIVYMLAFNKVESDNLCFVKTLSICL